MNQMCEVIREVSEDFSEIKVYPDYIGDLDGSMFCTACLAAPPGCHPSHYCEEHQNVIDAIRGSEPSMVVLVENRLLQDEPIEFKPSIKLRELVDTLKKEWDKLVKDNFNLTSDIKRLSEYLTTIKEDIYNSEIEQDSIITNLSAQRDKLTEITHFNTKLKKKLNALRGEVTIPLHEYVDLLKSDIKLGALEAGGVEHWEWYDESLLSEEKTESILKTNLDSLDISLN